jgi:hypothetical protein
MCQIHERAWSGCDAECRIGAPCLNTALPASAMAAKYALDVTTRAGFNE